MVDQKAKGAPVSDWSWWVGSDESIADEGLYDLHETSSREDAIEWAECHVNSGDRFHIIEARTRALASDDEFMPFVSTRCHAVFVVDKNGDAQEVTE